MERSGTKVFGVVLAIVAALMTVFRPRPDAPPRSGMTVITVSANGGFEDWKLWRDIARGFEAKNPDVWVKLIFIPSTRYDDKIRLLLAAEAAPDVMMIADEPLPAYGSFGKFVDLTDWTHGPEAPADWRKDLWPTAPESYMYKGRVIGVPIFGGENLIFYNREMFRDLGVAPPSDDWTFDDLVSKAKKLTRDSNGDGRIDTYGFALPGGWVYFLPFTWGFGADYLTASRTDWAFTGPQALAATQFYQDLRYKYKITPTVAIPSLQDDLERAMFMTGRIGMLTNGPWFSRGLTAAGIDFDVAHIPIGPCGKRYTRVTWDGVCIFYKSKHKEESLRFLDYCLSFEAQAIIGRQGRVPALVAAKDTYVKPESGWHKEKFIEALSYARVQPITKNWFRMNVEIGPEYNKLLYNKRTPEDMIRIMDEKLHEDNVFPIED